MCPTFQVVFIEFLVMSVFLSVPLCAVTTMRFLWHENCLMAVQGGHSLPLHFFYGLVWNLVCVYKGDGVWSLHTVPFMAVSLFYHWDKRIPLDKERGVPSSGVCVCRLTILEDSTRLLLWKMKSLCKHLIIYRTAMGKKHTVLLLCLSTALCVWVCGEWG